MGRVLFCGPAERNMIRIVEASDAAAVKALLWPERDRDGETEQRVSQIVAQTWSCGASMWTLHSMTLSLMRRAYGTRAKAVSGRVWPPGARAILPSLCGCSSVG